MTPPPKELEELEETAKRGIPRAIKLGIAVLLLFIFLIYIFPGDVLQVLEGRLESSTLSNDFKVTYKGGQVTFTEAAYQSLKEIYLGNPKTETKVCLIGERNNSNYFITDLYQPNINSQSVIHVSSEVCNTDTLISLHTHPFRHCLFSDQDISSHKTARKNNPYILTSIMCETDRFAFLS